MIVIVIAYVILLALLLQLSGVTGVSRFVVKSFLIIWSLSLFLSSLSIFDYFIPGIETYLILMVGIISYSLGMIVRYRMGNKNKSRDIIKNNLLDKSFIKIIRNKLFWIILIGTSLYETQYVVNAMLVAEELEAAVTSNIEDVKFMGNKFALLLSQYVMFPCFHIVCFTLAYSVIRRIKLNILYIISCIFFIIIFGILNSGRTLFIIAGLYFISCYAFLNNGIHLKRIFTPRRLFSILGGVMLLFIGMMYMTAYRVTGKFSLDYENINESLITNLETPLKYSVVPIVLFDYSLTHNYVDRFGGYKLGRMSFAGADMFITGPLRRIGCNISSTDEIIADLQNNWRPCSNSRRYNYAYTGFFFNYMDFGVLGIILIPFVFGIIFQTLILRFQRFSTLPLLILNCFCYYMMIHSIFSNYLHNAWMVFFIIILLIWDYTYRNPLKVKQLTKFK